jgi:hypothetical protein
MGCPSGVAEPDGTDGGFGLQQEGEAVIDLPLFLADFEFAIAEQSDPGAVIAAVFESAQTVEDQWPGGLVADVADDSTHSDAFCIHGGGPTQA